MYMDQTGKFLVELNQGNGYIMVMYEKDGNLILVEPMKTRAAGEMCWACKKRMAHLTKRGIKVMKHILDKEAFSKYLQAIIHKEITYEKMPRNIHHKNAAEKAIGTFKYHFQAIIAGEDRIFPMHLWNWLLPQVENMLNMLRPTNKAPTIS